LLLLQICNLLSRKEFIDLLVDKTNLCKKYGIILLKKRIIECNASLTIDNNCGKYFLGNILIVFAILQRGDIKAVIIYLLLLQDNQAIRGIFIFYL